MSNQSLLSMPLHAESGCVCDSEGRALAVALYDAGWPDGCNRFARAQERASAIASACNEYAALKQRVAELEAER